MFHYHDHPLESDSARCFQNVIEAYEIFISEGNHESIHQISAYWCARCSIFDGPNHILIDDLNTIVGTD